MNTAKRLWKSQNTGKGLAIVCLSLSILQGCSPKYPEAEKDVSGAKTGSTTSTTTDTATTTTSAATVPSTGTTDEAKAKDDKAASDKSSASKGDDKSNDAKAGKSETGPENLADQMPEIKAASQKVDIHSMPDTSVICTVKDTPITVGEYKEELKEREQKIQSMLTVDRNLERQLTEEASKRHVALTDVEKKNLLAQTKKAEKATGKLIADYLKENHQTEQQYEQEVMNLGLAAKVAAVMTREVLLNELVDKTLVVLAAKDKGMYQKALNKYIELKVTPDYKTFLNQSGLTADQAQNKVIDQQLISMFMDRLKEDNSTVPEQDIQKIYNEHAAQFKHGERYHLSQIVVAAPADSADQPGIKQQLRQTFPKLSDKDLEAKAVEYKAQQKRAAEKILADIQKGAKFEDLANQYTADPANQQMKNGGDIGWKEKSALEPDFVSKIATLKPGQVYPHLLPTRFGYHILKLVAKEDPGTTKLSDVHDIIKDQLVKKKQEQAIVDWVTTQHKSGVVKLSPEFQKLIAPTAAKTH